MAVSLQWPSDLDRMAKYGPVSKFSVVGKRLFLTKKKRRRFSLTHTIWDSCGHLGGRPRCITVRCRGVRSLAFPDQFCPTMSIKLSTAKVRRSKKCGGIKGARIPTGLGWDTPVYCEYRSRKLRSRVQATKDASYHHLRRSPAFREPKVREHYPEIQLYCRKPSWCVCSEEHSADTLT